MREWRAGKPQNRLEVNHRRPALGAHGTLSCVHHLDNLETLCVACHRDTTSATRPRRPPPVEAPPGAPPKREPVRKVTL
jgi:hypothetical protein